MTDWATVGGEGVAIGEAGGHLTNNTITNILNVICQWLENCWSWRGDYLGSLEATLQYSNFHLWLTGQLLVVKGWLLGEAGGHLAIFYIDLLLTGSLLVMMSHYFGNLETTFTRQLLVVKGLLFETSFCQFPTWLLPGLRKMLTSTISPTGGVTVMLRPAICGTSLANLTWQML